MGAFMKMAGVDGECDVAGYKDWITLATASSPIHRTIPAGARGVDRQKGSTVPGEIVVTRGVDKSSVKLAEKCAKGEMIDEVDLHFTAMMNGNEKAFMTFKLKKVIVTNWAYHGKYEGATPTEDLTLNYESVDWNFTAHKNGQTVGQVAASYSPR